METNLQSWGAAKIGENADRIYCRLARPSFLAEKVSEMPYERFLDVVVVCYMRLQVSPEESLCILVNNQHLESWNITRAQLKKLAWENTLRDGGLLFRPLAEVLSDAGMGSAAGDDPLYLLSNEQNEYGAIALLYPDALEKVAQYMGTDYYVLPSSVHECLVLQCGPAYGVKQLREMVRSINRMELAEKDILSDSVYRYSRTRKRLVIDNS